MQSFSLLVTVAQLVSNTQANRINYHVPLEGRKEEMARSRPNVGRGGEGQARPKQLTPNYKAKVRPYTHKG